MSSTYIVRRSNERTTTYQVKYRLGGRSTRIQHAGTFRTLRDARARASWVRTEIAYCRDPRATRPGSKHEKLTLAQAILCTAEERTDLSDNTKISYRTTAKAVPNVEVDDVTVEWIQKWLAQSVKHSAPATVATRLSVVRAALDHIGRDPNPARSNRVKTPRVETPDVSPVTNAEWNALQPKLSALHGLALATIEATGLRRSEALNLTWADIDLAASKLVVRHGKTKASRRVIDLAEHAPHLLTPFRTHRENQNNPQPNDKVFAIKSPGALASAMRRACRAAGITEHGPHALRHRRATIWVNSGMPLRKVAQLLGHTNPSTTLDVYTHVSVD